MLGLPLDDDKSKEDGLTLGMIVTLLIKINKHILHGIILVHIKYIKRRSRALILNFIDVFSEFDSHKILRKENIIIPLALHFKSNPQLSININNI